MAQFFNDALLKLWHAYIIIGFEIFTVGNNLHLKLYFQL